MRSHTGITWERIPFFHIHKTEAKSSTEAELVGVDDGMPIILWTRQFLIEQGFDLKDNVVYQDNQSAVLLERNGCASSGRRTRHVNIRYFFSLIV
jgi:hypothetical protein